MNLARNTSFFVSVLFAAFFGLAQLAWSTEPATPANVKVTLIYISAWNCPPCIAWARMYKPMIAESPVAEHLDFREVEAYRYQSIGEDGLWPEDLRWVRDELGLVRGTPRWVIINQGKIDLSGRGRDWTNRIWPRLIELTIGSPSTS